MIHKRTAYDPLSNIQIVKTSSGSAVQCSNTLSIQTWGNSSLRNPMEWDHTSNNARQCVLITALWYEHSVLISLTTPLKFWLHRAYWHHFDKIWPLTSRWTKKHLAKHTHTHTENNTSYNFVTGEISTLKLDLSSTGKSWLLACDFCWCWHFGGMHIISLRYGIKIGKTNKTIVCCQLRDNR